MLGLFYDPTEVLSLLKPLYTNLKQISEIWLTVFERHGLTAERGEVVAPHGRAGWHPPASLKVQEVGEETDALGVEAGGSGHQALRCVVGELVAGQLATPRDTRPCGLCRSA